MTTTTGRYPVPAEYGDRVRWHRKIRRHDGAEFFVSGEGVFKLCWLGIEETWDVLLDDGTTVSLYPVFGETMEKVE